MGRTLRRRSGKTSSKSNKSEGGGQFLLLDRRATARVFFHKHQHDSTTPTGTNFLCAVSDLWL